MSKLSKKLDDLRANVTKQAQARQAAVGSNRQLWKLQGMSVPNFCQVAADGAIQVYVRTKTVADSNVTQLKALGMRDVLMVPSMKVIEGWLPHDQILAAAALDFVARIDLPDYGICNAGSVTTQGDALLRANLVRQLGPPGPWTGAGIRVGVISDGVSNWTTSTNTFDLPLSGIAIMPGVGGSGNEGTAMCEIIYDMAPGVQFFFAGPTTSAQMVAAIQWMATNVNCHIICNNRDFFLDQPFFADGTIAQAARDAVVNRGRVFVSAAGNYARRHHQKLFTDAGFGWHNFKVGAGVDTGLDIYVPTNGTLRVTLQWDDPFGASANDYDLYLIDPLTGNIISQSIERQAGTDNPVESLPPWTNNTGSGRTVRVYVKRVAGVAKTLELFAYSPNNAQIEITDGNFVAADSIFGPAAVSEVISCGTINATNVGLNVIAPYSSCGPSTITFDTNGVFNPEIRQTPFITGLDGVAITGAGGFQNPFFGTSASAAHVAGICALLLDRRPLSTPQEIRDALAASAIDKGSPGYDNTYGWGLIDALGAINQIVTPVVSFAVSSEQSAVESGWVQVRVNLSAPAGETITIPFTIGGTATLGVDYFLTPSTNVITIPAGAAVGTNTFVQILTDSIPEWGETVVLTMGTPTNATLGATTVYTLTITDDDTPVTTNIIDGIVVNAPGTYMVGTDSMFNALIITNAGVLNDAIGVIGNSAAASQNRVYVTGAGSLWQNNNSLIVGSTGAYNRLTIDDGAVVSASNIVIGAFAGAISNQISVLSGDLFATNAAGGGALDIRRGILALNGGNVTVDRLYATNGANSVVDFYAGTLDTSGTRINNGSQFRVGNGLDFATMHLNGGTHSFANGLFINTNAMLTGTGAISGTIINAGTISPGDSVGVITGDNNLTLLSTALVLMELAGTDPSLYDQIDILGTLVFGGALQATLDAGFDPQVGDRFDLFDFSASSGNFSYLDLPSLAPDKYWYDGLLYTTGELIVGDRQ
ncbi:MAG: S8 family serine peptidase, partial [Verrucomicrobiae bacterium]|nr:S8 family serine peptidase [Verrucomicrobiae bacterium]